MRISLYRPRYQRNVRILLAFALLLPAGGVAQAAGPNPVSWALTASLVIAALLTVFDAYRRVLIVTRQGIGIVGTLGMGVTWLAWGEILQVEVDGVVVSITARGNAVYQAQLDERAARFLGRMIERNIVGRRL